MNLLGGDMFTMLGRFFKHNHNLTSINISACVFGDEGSRLFALALGSCTHKSLQNVTLWNNNIAALWNNNIAEEGMVDINANLAVELLQFSNPETYQRSQSQSLTCCLPKKLVHVTLLRFF